MPTPAAKIRMACSGAASGGVDTIEFSDNFTGAAALIGANYDLNGGTVWNLDGSGRLWYVGGSNDHPMRCTERLNGPGYFIQFTWIGPGDAPMAHFLCGSGTGSNGYRGGYTGGALGSWSIVRNGSSLATVLTGVNRDTLPGFFPKTIRYQVVGAAHKLYIDGVLTLSTTDGTPLTMSAGEAGLWCDGQAFNTKMDNLVIGSIS